METRVILRRSEKRLGLMNARIYGVQFATATTLTFLDSHCECVPGEVMIKGQIELHIIHDQNTSFLEMRI